MSGIDQREPAVAEATPHLEAVGLSKDFSTRRGPLRVLDHVDFRVQTSQRSLEAYRRVGLALPTAGSTLCHIHPDDNGPCDPVAIH